MGLLKRVSRTASLRSTARYPLRGNLLIRDLFWSYFSAELGSVEGTGGSAAYDFAESAGTDTYGTSTDNVFSLRVFTGKGISLLDWHPLPSMMARGGVQCRGGGLNFLDYTDPGLGV